MRSPFSVYRLIFVVAIVFTILLFNRHTNNAEPFISLKELMQRNATIQLNAQTEGAYHKVIGFMYKYPNNSHGIFKALGKSYFIQDCKYKIDWNQVLPPGKTKPLSPQTVSEANDAFRIWTQCINQKNNTCIQQLTDFNQRFLQNCKLKADALKSPKNFAPVF